MECPHCHKQTGVQSSTCNSCGRSIPPAQYLLEESGVVEPVVFEPVEESADGASLGQPDSPYRPATLGDRFVAFALDLLLLFSAFMILDAWVFMRWGVIEGSELRLSLAALLIAECLNAIALFVYFWVLETIFGATAGKALIGLCVVRVKECAPLPAFAIRNLFRVIDGLGVYFVGAVVAGCSRIHRRLGDLCAGTAVIEHDFGPVAKTVSLLVFLAAISGAIWSVPRICSTNYAVHTRYLNQVAVRVGRDNTSAYLTVGSFRIELHTPAMVAREKTSR